MLEEQSKDIKRNTVMTLCCPLPSSRRRAHWMDRGRVEIFCENPFAREDLSKGRAPPGNYSKISTQMIDNLVTIGHALLTMGQ